MTETLRVDGLTDDETATLNVLVEQLDRTSRRNLLRASYYDGKRAINQVGSVIPPQYYRMGLVLGWAGKAVDAMARRCNLDGFVWAGGDLESLGLTELTDENQLGVEINGAIVSSLIHGPSFLVTTRGASDEPDALVHAKDALNATGEWNTRTRTLDNLLSVTSRKDGKITGFVLYLRNLTISADRIDGKWQIDRSAHPWGVPVEPMIYKPRPGRWMGSSRISRTIMSIHDEALRTVIRMEGHSDVYSFPQMVLLGADEKIFRNADGSIKPAWQVALGRIFGVPDDDGADNPRADVKQFQAASPEPHIKRLREQAQRFAGEASIPVTALGIADTVNPSSADAIAEARGDLIAEAEGAMDDWSRPLRRTVARALAIKNGVTEIPREWVGIDAKWRSPIHLSKAAQADAGVKQLAAVPWLAETRVGLELLGLTEQQIQQALSERRRAQGSGVLEALRRAAGGAE